MRMSIEVLAEIEATEGTRSPGVAMLVMKAAFQSFDLNAAAAYSGTADGKPRELCENIMRGDVACYGASRIV